MAAPHLFALNCLLSTNTEAAAFQLISHILPPGLWLSDLDFTKDSSSSSPGGGGFAAKGDAAAAAAAEKGKTEEAVKAAARRQTASTLISARLEACRVRKKVDADREHMSADHRRLLTAMSKEDNGLFDAIDVDHYNMR